MSETVGVEEARRLIAAGEATAVDFREDEDWREDRIPGAIHVSGDDLDEGLSGIADEQRLIVIASEKRGPEFAGQLEERGREAAYLEGGLEAWTKEGFRTQPSEDPASDSVV
jgi:rhodanese-related sulfurtransferase